VQTPYWLQWIRIKGY
jgi:hypothetical protein